MASDKKGGEIIVLPSDWPENFNMPKAVFDETPDFFAGVPFPTPEQYEWNVKTLRDGKWGR